MDSSEIDENNIPDDYDFSGEINLAFAGIEDNPDSPPIVEENIDDDMQEDVHSGYHNNGTVDSLIETDAKAEGSNDDRDNDSTSNGTHNETSDIQQILEDMPSRTLGRTRGARAARLRSCANISNTISASNRQDAVDIDGVDDAELFEEISKNGIIDEFALRDLAVNMATKKRLRLRGKENENRIANGKRIGRFTLLKFKIALAWRDFRSKLYKFLVAIGRLWSNDLKLIEGNFGTGVVSYFTFLRGIFLLSLVSFVFTFVFISVPQLFERPQVPSCTITGEGILTGSNCLTNTLMYQGYYTNNTINAVGNAFYNMPLAYLLTVFGFFILCLIWLLRVTATLFREHFIDTHEEYTQFTNRVFCAWDFGIASQSAASVRSKSIVTELTELLAEQRRQTYHRSACFKCELVALRIVTWGFYFGLVGAAIAGVYFLNKTFICQIISETQGNPIFQDLALPIIVSAVNLIMPYIIDWLTSREKYKHPRHVIYISVFRNFLFKMGLLGVICAFWTSNNVERCNVNRNETICWETNLGQEIYRLVVVDFIFCLLFSTFCAEFIAKWISRKRGGKGPEFLIANNVMDLIYGQTLCWIGIYFSPILPLINVIKFFILFYVKRFSVLRNCQPSTKRWRASQSHALFNLFQLGSFLLCCGFLGYVVFNEQPSSNCGPFRGLSRAYDVVSTTIDDLAALSSGDWFATIIRIVTSVWVLDSVAIFLLIWVIFKKSETRGLVIIAKSLEEQLSVYGRDKKRLLKRLQRQCKHRRDVENSKKSDLLRQTLQSNASRAVTDHSLDEIAKKNE